MCTPQGTEMLLDKAYNGLKCPLCGNHLSAEALESIFPLIDNYAITLTKTAKVVLPQLSSPVEISG
jgi:hypothetical protein